MTESETTPTNVTPLVYTTFPHKKRVALRKELEEMFNRLSIDNEFGIPDFLLAEMTDNFLMTIYNTKTKKEEGF